MAKEPILEPSDEDGTVWNRPVLFAFTTGVSMFFYGLRVFDDVRGAALGGALSAVAIYLVARSGFRRWVWEEDQRRIERGDPEVRPAWMLRAAAIVFGVTAVLALLAWAAS